MLSNNRVYRVLRAGITIVAAVLRYLWLRLWRRGRRVIPRKDENAEPAACC